MTQIQKFSRAAGKKDLPNNLKKQTAAGGKLSEKIDRKFEGLMNVPKMTFKHKYLEEGEFQYTRKRARTLVECLKDNNFALAPDISNK